MCTLDEPQTALCSACRPGQSLISSALLCSAVGSNVGIIVTVLCPSSSTLLRQGRAHVSQNIHSYTDILYTCLPGGLATEGTCTCVAPNQTQVQAPRQTCSSASSVKAHLGITPAFKCVTMCVNTNIERYPCLPQGIPTGSAMSETSVVVDVLRLCALNPKPFSD